MKLLTRLLTRDWGYLAVAVAILGFFLHCLGYAVILILSLAALGYFLVQALGVVLCDAAASARTVVTSRLGDQVAAHCGGDARVLTQPLFSLSIAVIGYGPALRKSLSRRPGRASADRTGKRAFQRILSAGGMCGWLVAVGDVGFSHTGCQS